MKKGAALALLLMPSSMYTMDKEMALLKREIENDPGTPRIGIIEVDSHGIDFIGTPMSLKTSVEELKTKLGSELGVDSSRLALFYKDNEQSDEVELLEGELKLAKVEMKDGGTLHRCIKKMHFSLKINDGKGGDGTDD